MSAIRVCDRGSEPAGLNDQLIVLAHPRHDLLAVMVVARHDRLVVTVSVREPSLIRSQRRLSRRAAEQAPGLIRRGSHRLGACVIEARSDHRRKSVIIRPAPRRWLIFPGESMADIQIDAAKAERMIAQILRDEKKLLPADANALAANICRRLSSASVGLSPTGARAPRKGIDF